MRRNLRRLLLPVLVALTAIASCTVGPSSRPPLATYGGLPRHLVRRRLADPTVPIGPGGPGRDVEPISWSPCRGDVPEAGPAGTAFDVECGSVRVPITYRSAGSTTFSLQVARARAAGVPADAPNLVVISGSPGQTRTLRRRRGHRGAARRDPGQVRRHHGRSARHRYLGPGDLRELHDRCATLISLDADPAAARGRRSARQDRPAAHLRLQRHRRPQPDPLQHRRVRGRSGQPAGGIGRTDTELPGPGFRRDPRCGLRGPVSRPGRPDGAGQSRRIRWLPPRNGSSSRRLPTTTALDSFASRLRRLRRRLPAGRRPEGAHRAGPVPARRRCRRVGGRDGPVRRQRHARPGQRTRRRRQLAGPRGGAGRRRRRYGGSAGTAVGRPVPAEPAATICSRAPSCSAATIPRSACSRRRRPTRPVRWRRPICSAGTSSGWSRCVLPGRHRNSRWVGWPPPAPARSWCWARSTTR